MSEKDCGPGMVRNPKSKRCISKEGALYKKLLKEGTLSRSPRRVSPRRVSPRRVSPRRVSPKKKTSKRKRCPDGTIRNPKTKRCISKEGVLYKQLVEQGTQFIISPERKSPDRKSPDRKSPDRKSPERKRRKSSRKPARECPPNKVRHPITGRCITKKFYEELMMQGNKHKSPRRYSPRREPSSPLEFKTHEYKSPQIIHAGDDIACIKRSKLPLKEHQKHLVSQLQQQRGLLAIHAVGSGKTLTAVAASQGFLDMNPQNKVIVITPTSLQNNFKKEMKQYDPDINFRKYEFYTIDGFVRAYKKGQVDCKNNMMIVDEAHNLRTEVLPNRKKPKGSKVIEILKCSAADNASKVLLLTATPFVNETYDIVNLISIIDGVKPMKKGSFSKIEDNDELFKQYFKCKVSIFEPDVKETEKFYPKHKIHDVFIPMSPEFEAEYIAVEKEEEKVMNMFPSPSVFYNGVRRASNKLETVVGAPKTNWIGEFLDTHPTGKIVMFSNWLSAGLTILKSILEERKIEYLHIDGSMDQKTRLNAVEKYNKDEIRVLLISKAGSEGLDLKATRYMILTDPGWNPSSEEQIIGRGIRFKSHYHLPEDEQKVDVYKLYATKSREFKHIDSKGSVEYEDLNKMKTHIGTDKAWSVDLYLRALAKHKKDMVKNNIARLRPLSIEKRKC